MGRWASRSRRGGGPGSRPPPTISITDVNVVVPSDGQLDVSFSAAVDVANFSPLAFTDTSLGTPADDVSQVSPVILRYHALSWEGIGQNGDPWLYTDSVDDVITPQSGFVD